MIVVGRPAGAAFSPNETSIAVVTRDEVTVRPTLESAPTHRWKFSIEPRDWVVETLWFSVSP
jgi:hypothetical protein